MKISKTTSKRNARRQNEGFSCYGYDQNKPEAVPDFSLSSGIATSPSQTEKDIGNALEVLVRWFSPVGRFIRQLWRKTRLIRR